MIPSVQGNSTGNWRNYFCCARNRYFSNMPYYTTYAARVMINRRQGIFFFNIG